MAIPPIISSFSFLKLFKSGDDSAEGQKAASGNDAVYTPQSTEDVVEISEVAQQKLDGIRNFTSDKPEEIQGAAGESREILAQTSFSLGLDPAFAQ